MAYVALSSLMYTLEQLLKHDQSLVYRSCIQHHVQSLCQNLSELQLFLEDTTTKDIGTLKVIEKRIRNVVYKAEDRVDSSLRSIILADREHKRQKAWRFFYKELLKVEEQVYFLNKEVIEFNKHGSRSAELATTPSSPEKGKLEETTIIGMENDFNTIFDHLTNQTDELTVIPIFGMGGIGKTTLSRKLYDDPYIRSRFDKHAWLTISEEYNEREVLLEIGSSITGSNQEMSDDQLMEFVYRGLKGRRFLIVIDDIWSTEAWDKMHRIFPNDDNKSRILLTTRLKYIADYVSSPDFPPHCKSFLSLDDSWNLFTEKVFKKDPCPPHLEETGKHIVRQCQGLPLSIVVVAGLIGKMDPTHENWKNIEENLSSFFGTVSRRCQSILSLSYNYLPQHLRAGFLYVGSFPEDREIEVSWLIRLWIAEQFVRGRSNKRLELVAEEYLQELIDRSLILAGRQRANGRMKTVKIHDLLRQLCLSEACTENFIHITNTNVLKTIYNQQRVIHLSCLQEKHSDDITSITRTFISMPSNFSMGLYISKGIGPILLQLKLLKVLDVLTIRCDFSRVIPQFVHLRYVAARIKEALSLAKLRSLQTIILRGLELRENTFNIWTMSELRHVDIRWPLYISDPLEAENNSIGEQLLFLNNLQTLYLSNSTYVAEIIRRTPHLKELKISYSNWLAILDSLILLEDLEILDIALETTDPKIFSGDIFPPNLKELRLSDTYIPWEDVNLLANLPNLEVLKGRRRAFAGTHWKLDEDVVFRKLKYIGFKYQGLKRWEASSDNFPMLEKLVLYRMDELEEIPESIGEIMTLKLIKIDECRSALENSAKRIQAEQESLGNYELQVHIRKDRYETIFKV